MTTWEYSFMIVPPLNAETGAPGSPDDVLSALNAKGDEGWELSILTTATERYDVYWFKRPRR